MPPGHQRVDDAVFRPSGDYSATCSRRKRVRAVVTTATRFAVENTDIAADQLVAGLPTLSR